MMLLMERPGSCKRRTSFKWKNFDAAQGLVSCILRDFFMSLELTEIEITHAATACATAVYGKGEHDAQAMHAKRDLL